jgi:hypothetical protein
MTVIKRGQEFFCPFGFALEHIYYILPDIIAQVQAKFGQTGLILIP